VALGGLGGRAEHLRRAHRHGLRPRHLVAGPVDLHAEADDAVDGHPVPAAPQHRADHAAEGVAEHGHPVGTELGGQLRHVRGVDGVAVGRLGERQPVPAQVRRGPPTRPGVLELGQEPGPHRAGGTQPVQEQQQRAVRPAGRVRDAAAGAPHQTNLSPVSCS
jgi:hypothetical protein